MNETTKTAVFVLLAVALITGAIFSRPTRTDFKADEMVGQSLFPKFTDPLAIKSLEIVQFDTAGERNDFRITEVNGIWSIPSHDNYPADAKDQMGKVAEALTDLTVLEVIQPEGTGIDAIDFQTQYGVIDPTSDNTSFGEGVGIKVTLEGASKERLVNLIIGKPVSRQQSEEMMGEGGSNLRYVRIADQSPVYVISIDPSQFSTSFDQWIEKNLLDISTFDIKEFFVDEYSFAVEIVLTNQGPRPVADAAFIGDITLAYNASAVGAEKWSLAKWLKFEGQDTGYKERQLESDKELNTETLDAMVSALNDLKIVNVQKKPAGLASVLREGKTFEDVTSLDEAMQSSMRETGFWLLPFPDLKGNSQEMKTQLLSNEGDLQLRLKDGVVYSLRFGDLTGTETEIAAEDDTTPMMGANRYLFITAEFNPAIIPEPELKPVPEIPEEGEAEELEKLKQEKEAVETANKREQERYDAEIESGKKRAAELSARFADWYYVISEDVYKKIHLTEENVFRSPKLPEADQMLDNVVPSLPDLDTEPLPEDRLPELPSVDVEWDQELGTEQNAAPRQALAIDS
jgi:hypothetical protein